MYGLLFIIGAAMQVSTVFFNAFMATQRPIILCPSRRSTIACIETHFRQTRGSYGAYIYTDILSSRKSPILVYFMPED